MWLILNRISTYLLSDVIMSLSQSSFQSKSSVWHVWCRATIACNPSLRILKGNRIANMMIAPDPPVLPLSEAYVLSAAAASAHLDLLLSEENGPLTPAEEAQIIKDATTAIEQVLEERMRRVEAKMEQSNKDKLAARQTTKRAPMISSTAGLKSLVAMNSKTKAEARQKDLSLNPESFLVYNVSNWDSLVGVVAVMIKTLSVVALLAYAAVRGVESALAATTLNKSVQLQYRNATTNLTATELVRTEGFQDPFASDRSEAAIKVTLVGTAVFWTAVMWACAASLGLQRARPYVAIACPFPGLLALVYLLYGPGGASLSGVAVACLAVVAAGLSAILLIWGLLDEKASDAGFNMQYIVGKRAAQLLKGGVASSKKLLLQTKLNVLVIGSLPVLFILGVMLLYTTLIFFLFGASSTT